MGEHRKRNQDQEKKEILLRKQLGLKDEKLLNFWMEWVKLQSEGKNIANIIKNHPLFSSSNFLIISYYAVIGLNKATEDMNNEVENGKMG